MWERVMNTHERSTTFVLDPGYGDAARLLQPALKTFHKLDPAVFFADPIKAVPFRKRSIDVLIPLSFFILEDYAQIRGRFSDGSDFQKLCDKAYDALKDNYTDYPLAIFSQVVKEMFSIDISQTALNDRDLFMRFMNLLSRLDGLIRIERRVGMVKSLLKDARGLNVHVAGKLPPDVAELPNIVPLGSLRTAALGQVMADSRMVVHCHPTYPDGLHERPINAMANGSVVVSDHWPMMASTFAEGEEWVCWRSGMSLREATDEFGMDRLEHVAQTACGKAWREFSMPRHVDRILEGILHQS